MTHVYVTCFVLMALTLGVGGALTQIGPWYFGLDVPPWKPPNWAFGPIWTVIGICTAFSAAQAWSAEDTGQHALVATLFAVNAVLNMAWSLLFFRLRRPDWALGEVALLWLSVLVPMIALWPLRRSASLLLVPYLIWVTTAAALNLSVVRRNAPFGLA